MVGRRSLLMKAICVRSLGQTSVNAWGEEGGGGKADRSYQGKGEGVGSCQRKVDGDHHHKVRRWRGVVWWHRRARVSPYVDEIWDYSYIEDPWTGALSRFISPKEEVVVGSWSLHLASHGLAPLTIEAAATLSTSNRHTKSKKEVEVQMPEGVAAAPPTRVRETTWQPNSTSLLCGAWVNWVGLLDFYLSKLWTGSAPVEKPWESQGHKRDSRLVYETELADWLEEGWRNNFTACVGSIRLSFHWSLSLEPLEIMSEETSSTLQILCRGDRVHMFPLWFPL